MKSLFKKSLPFMVLIFSIIKVPNTIYSVKDIVVPHEELMEFDGEFEKTFGIESISLDKKREAYLDTDENKLYVPINENYVIKGVNSKSDIKEISGGVKIYIARKNPRENPDACQGGCKCGIGFRCGRQYVITIKPKMSTTFDEVKREALAKHYIDTVKNYYIMEFLTKNINWEKLNDE